jgi:hypothetical protein
MSAGRRTPRAPLKLQSARRSNKQEQKRNEDFEEQVKRLLRNLDDFERGTGRNARPGE